MLILNNKYCIETNSNAHVLMQLLRSINLKFQFRFCKGMKFPSNLCKSIFKAYSIPDGYSEIGISEISIRIAFRDAREVHSLREICLKTVAQSWESKLTIHGYGPVSLIFLLCYRKSSSYISCLSRKFVLFLA